MKTKVLSIKMGGRWEDKNDVLLDDFLDFFGSTLRCLREIDRHISGKKTPSVDYKITDLKRGSAVIDLEPTMRKRAEDYTARIVETFTDGLVSLQEKGEAPPHFEKRLIKSFKALAKPLSKRTTGIEIRSQGMKITITKRLEENIERILGEAIESQGSLAGQLDVVNVHEENFFYIYPVVGPTRVACHFPEWMLEQIKAALKKYVGVSGRLLYKPNEVFPYQVDVETMEPYPPEEELPTLADLRGIAPDMTEGVDSVEFVRRLRDAE